jgi:hypothetical protein
MKSTTSSYTQQSYTYTWLYFLIPEDKVGRSMNGVSEWNIKDESDVLKELASMRLDIMDKTEWIYIADDRECRLSFFFLEQRFVT